MRIVAATNRDLHGGAAQAQFREDLYFRLNVVPITVPPLRERREDIPLLVEHFMAKLCAERKRPPRKLSTGRAARRSASYPWPGNVRELRNLVEKMVVLSSSDTVLKEEIEFYLADNRFQEPATSGRRRTDPAPGAQEPGKGNHPGQADRHPLELRALRRRARHLPGDSLPQNQRARDQKRKLLASLISETLSFRIENFQHPSNKNNFVFFHEN